MKNTLSYKINSINEVFERLLLISKSYRKSAVYYSSSYQDKYSSYDLIAGIGETETFSSYNSKTAMNEFAEFARKHKTWLFNVVSYDVKNNFEKLSSNNTNRLNFPEIASFSPEFLIQVKSGILQISSDKEKQDIENFYTSLQNTKTEPGKQVIGEISESVSKKEYLDKIQKIQNHIQKGDVYELNYCIEYNADYQELTPEYLSLNLNRISPVPFFAFYKFDSYYLLSASPERFIKKNGELIISQPIKGTIKRSSYKAEDNKMKEQLANSEKDKSENVMIVDLVRNDLSKIAQRSTVKPEELFGIYTFPQVHQMISTVSCKMKENTSIFDIFKALFPPGSMTGAPKIRAMELIEEYENTKRSWYSGTVGYISPEMDFDFNVIIRSLLINSSIKKLSFEVGGAITSKSDADNEYEECLLKAKAIMQLLKNEKDVQ